MDYTTVQAVLNDLPPTFKRRSANYNQLIDAFSFALTIFAQGCDGTTSQVNFSNAQYGWLDVWGLLFGIPRFVDEATEIYAARIAFEVLAGAGPPRQIERWTEVVFHVEANVAENFPDVGYSITFPGSVTNAVITQILAGLAFVRPAGVPITGVFTMSGGTILETINFFNAPEVVGAYLTGGAGAVPVTLAASTNNAQPLLPGLFLTDPALNVGAV